MMHIPTTKSVTTMKTLAKEAYPPNNERYEIRECGEHLTELAVYIKNTDLLEAKFVGCDRYSLARKYCAEH